MAETISIKDFTYGPNPFDFRLGGNRYFDATIEFSGTPPATFDYQMKIHDDKGNIPITFSESSVSVNPDGTGTVHVAWDGAASIGAEAGSIGYGAYRPELVAQASGCDELSYPFCNGCTHYPPPDDCECDEPCGHTRA